MDLEQLLDNIKIVDLETEEEILLDTDDMAIPSRNPLCLHDQEVVLSLHNKKGEFVNMDTDSLEFITQQPLKLDVENIYDCEIWNVLNNFTKRRYNLAMQKFDTSKPELKVEAHNLVMEELIRTSFKEINKKYQ